MRIHVLIIFLFATLFCNAQSSPQVTTRYLAWGGVFTQYNFSPHLNIHLDVQARNEFTDGDWFNWLIRTGVMYSTKKDLRLSAGIAYFKLYPNPNTMPPRPEWRAWQEIGKRYVKNRHVFYPRFRFEQRIIKEYAENDLEHNLDKKFSFSVFRWRFRLDYTYDFNPAGEKSVQLLAGYEYLFNTKLNGKSYFDQNRVTAGIGYRLNENITLQLMYLNLFLRRGNNVFEQHHIARFTFVVQVAKKSKS